MLALIFSFFPPNLFFICISDVLALFPEYSYAFCTTGQARYLSRHSRNIGHCTNRVGVRLVRIFAVIINWRKQNLNEPTSGQWRLGSACASKTTFQKLFFTTMRKHGHHSLLMRQVKGSDQTATMRRLIWASDGRWYLYVGLTSFGLFKTSFSIKINETNTFFESSITSQEYHFDRLSGMYTLFISANRDTCDFLLAFQCTKRLLKLVYYTLIH